MDKEILAMSETDSSGHRVPPNYMYNTGSEQVTGNPEHDANNRCRNQASEDQLGPLPSNWEKAYTDTGEVYFIECVKYMSRSSDSSPINEINKTKTISGVE